MTKTVGLIILFFNGNTVECRKPTVHLSLSLSPILNCNCNGYLHQPFPQRISPSQPPAVRPASARQHP